MRFALLLLVSGCFAAKTLQLPPDVGLIKSIHCDVQPAPDKPGFMPGWYVRIKTVDVHEKQWERLLDVFPKDKLAKATAQCSAYLTQFNEAVRKERQKQKSKTVE